MWISPVDKQVEDGRESHPTWWTRQTVTLDALKAAMKPTSSDYLFFMLNPDGSHNFSATYAEHLENIRAFRAYQKKKAQEANNTVTKSTDKSKA